MVRLLLGPGGRSGPTEGFDTVVTTRLAKLPILRINEPWRGASFWRRMTNSRPAISLSVRLIAHRASVCWRWATWAALQGVDRGTEASLLGVVGLPAGRQPEGTDVGLPESV